LLAPLEVVETSRSATHKASPPILEARAPVMTPVEEPLLRGGADTAFAQWIESEKYDPVQPSRCMLVEDEWDTDIEDALFKQISVAEDPMSSNGNAQGVKGLYSPPSSSPHVSYSSHESSSPPHGLRLDTQFTPHRFEPLSCGTGVENLVCSLRPFTLRVTLADEMGQSIDDPSLSLVVSLVYSDSGLKVEPQKGEPPLSGELEMPLVDGAATFRLRVCALSYHHRRQCFRLLVQTSTADRYGISLTSLTAPLRSVARLPNETKDPAKTDTLHVAMEPSVRLLEDTGSSSSIGGALAGGKDGSSPANATELAGAGCSALWGEVQELRSQMKVVAAENVALQDIVKQQATQLLNLASMQNQILQELRLIHADSGV